MTLKIPLGISDFRDLREGGFEYIDKTHLITELLDRPAKLTLLPRPRRFGKSLNLSTLRWYFEKRPENLWHLFAGLHVDRAGQAYRAHFQQYPVIHVSFKGTKADTWEGCQREIRKVIRELYQGHRPAVEGKLEGWDAKQFKAIVEGSDDWGLYPGSLYDLTKYLHQAHGKRAIVLVDEYDAPIHAGYAQGYYHEVVSFMRSLFEAGLKDNPHLEWSVMTGILRVSKESIFSGLNHAAVFTVLNPHFNTCFGFTDEEVQGLLERAGLGQYSSDVRKFYNGYDFGGVAIYNPWSILSYLHDVPPSPEMYWLNTSANDLIRELLQHHAFAVEQDIRTLLEGGKIEHPLHENIVFPELKKDSDTLWSLLVFSGYLKALKYSGEPLRGFSPYTLMIPNEEVAAVYRTTFQSWMKEGLQAQGGALNRMLQALLEGDESAFEAQLQAFAMYCASFHDIGARTPERFYHGLMLGLLASLEPEYEVRSNRESGEGRPDVWIRPRRAGRPGAVLELKAARKGKRTLAQALKEGHAQFQKHDYAAEMRAAGVQTVQSLIIAFDGKKVKVERAKEAPKKKAGAAKKVGQAIRKAARKVVGKR